MLCKQTTDNVFDWQSTVARDREKEKTSTKRMRKHSVPLAQALTTVRYYKLFITRFLNARAEMSHLHSMSNGY